MQEMSLLLILIFLVSALFSAMTLVLKYDNVKHQRNLALVDRDYWKQMYEIEKKRTSDYPNDL